MTQNDINTTPSDIIEEMWNMMCQSANLPEDKAVYVLKEVSKLFGVSMSTVRRWSSTGNLRSWLLGPRKRVVAIQELKRYLTEQANYAN
tara:strand:+ start:8922 stop:9188 length:267 start_codon:yes stop_codon:yes gene_type:complete